MLLRWFDARQATDIGVSLADDLAPITDSAVIWRRSGRSASPDGLIAGLLRRADRETQALRLNFYKRAKLANSFKWRLLERGVKKELVDEITQTLVIHLSASSTADATIADPEPGKPAARPDVKKPDQLLALARQQLANGAYGEAIALYETLLEQFPRNTVALNNLGAALCKLGRYDEAEQHLQLAIRLKPKYAEAHGNLGSLLRAKGQLAASEQALRVALKLKPTFVDARASLGVTCLTNGRYTEAKAHLRKALRLTAAHHDALLASGHLDMINGDFSSAEATFRRLSTEAPNSPGAWAALAGLRKMTSSDEAWFRQAERIASAALLPLDEATLRFAMGKYCDETGDFGQAFAHYKRANDLMKEMAAPFDRAQYASLADALIGLYKHADNSQLTEDACASSQPVFVVGMPRSGTSLVEQIIASHPQARGAGEVDFWGPVVHQREFESRTRNERLKRNLAQAYLHKLAERCGDPEALRIVDKSPANSDYLGLIHSVFPNARIIYMRRHPIDSCLSSYFQQFPLSMSFKLDLADLADYYRQHHRLITHWRSVLPSGSILDVPYSELVDNQELWTRRIIDFSGLQWDEKCLNFQSTQRSVGTASSWQVRQTIYRSSIDRWRNYSKYLGPLRQLESLDK